MEKNPNAPRSLTFSTRFYQALLAFYPSEFRQAYGGPMQQVFRDSCQRALREAGTWGLLSLWHRTMLDTVQTALEEHAQRGVDMSKAKFIKLSGWALILAGFVLSLGLLASSRPAYDQNNFFSLPVDQVLNAAALPLIVIGLLLLSLGLTGLIVCYGQRAGSFGRFSLGLGILSGVVSAMGAIGGSIVDSNLWWSMFYFGLIFQFLGLTLFGLSSLRQRTLPRWNGLPVLTGVWIPLVAVVTLIIEKNPGEGWLLLAPAYPILWMLTLAGLILLGHLLRSDSQPAGMAAAEA